MKEFLADDERLKRARIHPFNVLLALKQYQAGHGEKGKLNWSPNRQIITALDKAFYKTFKVQQFNVHVHMLMQNAMFLGLSGENLLRDFSQSLVTD